MRKQSILIKGSLSLLLAIFLTIGYFFMPQSFFSLDNRLRDFMFLLRDTIPHNDKVVIVDIDEKSLKTYGQWPWSRDIVSNLLLTLSNEYQAGVIGLDIVFAEADRTSPHKLLEKFPNIAKTLPNYDEILANTFASSPIIGGYIFEFNPKNEPNESPIIPAIVIRKNMKHNARIFKPNNVILNIPKLQDSLFSSGFFNNLPDPNGMIRSVPLIMEYDLSIYTSLALEMVRVSTGANRLEVVGDDIGVKSIDFGDFKIPVDASGRIIVNFRGGSHHYPYFSSADILNHTIDPKEIQGKFVLIGTSALGLFDLRAIPFTSNIPGVEIHANVIDNILSGDILHTPPNHQIMNIGIVYFLIFFTMITLSFIRSWLVLIAGVILLILFYYVNFVLLFEYHLVFSILFPLLAIGLSTAIVIAVDYTLENRQKMEVKKILGKKVSPAVMDYLLKHSQEQLVASREVETTIFFSDIVGFTNISEKVGSPDKLIAMLNTYMTPMVQSIIKQEGTIDKFIGDAVMAYWNAPISIAQHADKAVQSAIEQIEMLKNINRIVTPQFGVVLDIGIGLHTGLVTAGDMGAEGRSDYTILGDNVNLASRLEGLTRVYDVQILISRSTYDALEEKSYLIRPIDLVEVKGKSVAVEIFEVICNTKVISKEELTLYHQAITYFREEELKHALKAFNQLQAMQPSKLYQNYLQRIHHFLENPTLPFTPILKMSTK